MTRHFLASLGLTLTLTLSAPVMAAPQVATDIAPVQSLVARVMAGAGMPALIVPPGASPHGHAMRPSEAAALERAEVVFWIGEALTPWLEEPIDTLAGDAHVIELLGAGGSSVLGFREGISFAPDGDDHGHGHDHDHEHDHEHDHGHAHDGADPHAWLDPANARAWLGVIAAELGALDPGNATLYAANAAEAVAELDALEARVAARLAPLQEAPYLVFHDAYQYFEARFGLRPVAALSPGDASDPGPARLAALRDLASAKGIVCVFSEPQFDGRRVTAVFGEEIRHGVLDPLGRGHVPGPALYPALIEDMAAALSDCLTGRG